MKSLVAATALLLFSLTALAVDERTPEQVVTETAETLADRIEGQQEALTNDPPALYALVSDIFLPVFDTNYAGQLVLGDVLA